jgi:hypothetical protein
VRAAATPLYGAFQSAADTKAFDHVEPRIALDEVNGPDAYGAALSARMDLSEPDRAPERLLTDIIWRSVHGADSVAPAPVRSAFLRHGVRADDDDDDRPARSQQ